MCPTCDHTMQRLGKVESGEVYDWCPRCGTIGGVFVDEPPMLAKRTADVIKQLADQDRDDCDFSSIFLSLLHQRGVTESCMLPTDRPQL